MADTNAPTPRKQALLSFIPMQLSLKGKLTAVTVGALLVFIWALVFYSVTVLQSRFEQVLSDQQFAAVKRQAADLDTKLTERAAALEAVAAHVPADLQPHSLDPFLAQFRALHIAFSGGIAIIGLDGKAIADFPAAPGRRGTYFGDRDYFRKVLETGKPYIDKPIMGRALHRPVMVIGVPVPGPRGIRAVMTGIVDLTAPNFLGVISNQEMSGKGEFFVFSPQDNMIIAATDAQRAMTALPPRGINLVFDRFMGGFEGSGISLSSQGISKLYSAKRVPATGWMIMAALPVDVAFSPVRDMQRHLFAAAAVLTIVVLLLVRWSMRKVLSPLVDAGAAMQRMTNGEQPLSTLPIKADDEVGQLIGHFNSLVEDRRRHEAAQQRLNRALRLLSACNQALVHAEHEQHLLDDICRLVVGTGGYRMAWAGYAEADDAKTVRPVSRAGEADDYLHEVRISWSDNEYGQGPTGTAIRTRQTQVNQNFLSNPDALPWREKALHHGFHSSIAIPLLDGKDALGALCIYSADPDSFAQDEVRLLEELANDLAFGINTLRGRARHVATQEQLQFLEHYDPLTHLPNQVLLRDRFTQALAQRHHAGVALMCLDLDNFKRINDSMGHAAGDRLLVAVVERLRRCIRDTDTVSRQSGDEFVILLTGIENASAAGRVAQSLLDTVAEPFDIDGNAVTTSFSIGISLYPGDGRDFDTMLKNADAALTHAKDNGRDTYHFFTASMNVDSLARIHLHSNLRKAVKNCEFVLHYQPQFDIDSERIVGAEALVRWQREEDSLVPPGLFIPLAEETGLIVQIGEWVLKEACRQARQWQDAGMPLPTIAVNLSAQQFRRGDLLETVKEALRDSGLPPHCLELELTESMLLQDAEQVLELLHTLKALGVKLSIDDFGTGYSSLAYLKRLAVDKLKIDQSFVRDLADNPEDAAIVHAMIQLSHTLQLRVIAEGVETERQLACLRDYGCDDIQGYLLSKPLPAAEFTAFISRRT